MKRNQKKILLKEFSDRKDLDKILQDAENGSVESLDLISELYHVLSLKKDLFDSKKQLELYFESIICAEKLFAIDEEVGVYRLATNLFYYPLFDNKQLTEKLQFYCMFYSLMGWDKYVYLDCGTYAADLYFNAPLLKNDDKSKELLLQLDEEDHECLPDLFFFLMGHEIIEGKNFPYSYDKAKEMFQVVFDRGRQNAFSIMGALMNKYNRTPSDSPSNNNSKKSNGCYIATCVYGSYDCPEVWVLRRYRDFKLSKTWWGRVFIKIYYAFSPSFVKRFGHTKIFNIFLKKD